MRLQQIAKGVVSVLLLMAAHSAWAGNANDEADEWAKRIKTAQVVGALGNDLFGDSINYYNGQLSFSVADIDIPGNNSLPVRVARTRGTADTERLDAYSELFADWELDIPYMKGTFASSKPWQVGGSSPDNRCSGASSPVPPSITNYDQQNGTSYTWAGPMYWRGNTVYVPGVGSQEVLVSNVMPSPSDGQTTKYYTSKFWQLRCGVSLANAGSNGFAGEGFLVLAPDGTKYTFNWMTSRAVRSAVVSMAPAPGSTTTRYSWLPRVEVRIYPTRVEDRFGNWVKYNWSGSQLNSITASDGRSITLSYDGSGHIKTATTGGGQIWTYSYNSSLTTVTLPDQSAWQYSLPTAFKPQYSTQQGAAYQPDCNRPGLWNPATQNRTLHMVHPSGAVGDFVLTLVRHGRTRVNNNCELAEPSNPYGYHYYGPPIQTDNFAVTGKQISGPGLTAATWSISYALSSGCSQYQGCLPGDPINASDRESITVTNPDQSQTRHTFGVRHYLDEGKLLRTETLSSSGSTLKDVQYSYAINPSNPPYPYVTGFRGGFFVDDFSDTYLVPRTRTVTIQNGDTYTNVVNSFDAFARELSFSRSTSFGGSRTDVTAYFDDLNRWVLGQVKSSTNSNTGLTEKSVTFGALSDKPEAIYAFGRLQSSMAYATDGTLTTVRDPANNSTSLSNWKRGLPQTVRYPDLASESLVINDNGWITSSTDGRSNTTTYGYDALGRLTSLAYPTGGSVSWSSTSQSFVYVASSEFGVAANHWKQTVTTGNQKREIFFDALLRPVLTRDYDGANATATQRFVRRTFDYAGRETFASYPSTDYGSTAGISTQYDALGRETKKIASDGAVLEAISYLSSNIRRVTDADQKTTDSYYQAFGGPEYQNATKIVAPEGQTTVISRDVFGKMLSVTQSGTWSGGSTSLTRTFGYDSSQRPCKRVDPEAGATLWGYDSANRLAWEARGQASTASCQTTAPSGAITYGYDVRSRKTQDGDSSFGYDAANNLTSANNPTAKWSYAYNNRNQLDSEKAVVDGASFTFSYGYNALGNLSSLTTPARTLSYGPDVWGRPSQVGSTASGIQYFPSGTIRSYSLGNGLSVSQGLDGRQRLASQQLKSGATLRQGYSYTYSNGNDLQTLTDQVNGADSLSASYDGLHRLQSATGIWGTYSYVYDPLNNLRSRGGASSLSYNYNATSNRLSSVSGATTRSYSYNANGEVTGDGSKSYVLNAKGQITTISGVADYGYDAHGKRIKSTLSADGRIEYALYSLSGQLRFSRL